MRVFTEYAIDLHQKFQIYEKNILTKTKLFG